MDRTATWDSAGGSVTPSPCQHTLSSAHHRTHTSCENGSMDTNNTYVGHYRLGTGQDYGEMLRTPHSASGLVIH